MKKWPQIGHALQSTSGMLFKALIWNPQGDKGTKSNNELSNAAHRETC